MLFWTLSMYNPKRLTLLHKKALRQDNILTKTNIND